jgi:hypothetical protein
VHDFFKSLAWLEPVVELARLGIFLVFVGLVVLSIVCVVRRRPEAERRRAAQALVGFAVAVTSLVGFAQIDAWPFTNWALVHSLRSPAIRSWEMEATDAAGRLWTVDPRVLQPMAPEEFGQCLPPLSRWPAEERAPVLRFLYERAEASRRVVAAGRPFPRNDRILGPLSAPYHFTARRFWNGPADVPGEPFVSLRLSFLEWDAWERRRDGDLAIRRTLIGEYRPGG